MHVLSDRKILKISANQKAQLAKNHVEFLNETKTISNVKM